MILDEKAPDVLVSGDFQETGFSIDETSDYIIFDMLRSKIYKNNIGAICREVACNGRDAHREAGKKVTPIEIEISDKRDSFFYEDGLNIIFRDRGVGISPERVRDIYTKYGASTKRDSNTMTGGFGLGSKTPFSYADAFLVRTIVSGIEYVYSIYIDSTRKGKMALLFQENVTYEGNLTEIIIPVKQDDLERFEEEVIKNTHFWPIRPILKNFESSYEEFKPPTSNLAGLKLEEPGKYFVITKERFIESNINVIIDGIYYPVDLKIVKYDFANYKFCICFIYENGELNISANRESLQYDDATINSIRGKVDDIFNEFKKQYENMITNAATLFEAQLVYNRACGDNYLFDIIAKSHKFDYHLRINGQKMEVVQMIPSKKHSFSTINISYYEYYGGQARKEELDNIYSQKLTNCITSFYHIKQEDNIIHKKRLSTPINRTLGKQHKHGYVILSDKIPDDYSSYNYLQADFDAKNKEERTYIDKLGLTTLDYWQVVPEKLERKKREKRETVILKTFSNGQYDRVDEFVYKDGYFESAGKKIDNIYYYLVEEERSISEELRDTLHEVSKLISKISPGSFISVSSKFKKRLFKNYSTIEDFIIVNEDKVKKYIERNKLDSSITKAANYNGVPFESIIKEEFDYLKALSAVEDQHFKLFYSFLRERMPKFEYRYKNFDGLFKSIKDLYPLIESIGQDNFSTRARNINQYVNLINDYTQLKKMSESVKEEKQKYDKFIN